VTERRRARAGWGATGTTAAALAIGFVALAVRAEEPTREATRMQARGAFEVEVKPVAADEAAEGAALRRYSLVKRFRGELEGASQGEMLTVETAVEGSGVYVAVERVNGTLAGRQGSFALAHRGTMVRGATELDIRIVEDSGSGALAGISGRFHVRIEPGGAHLYELEYTLP
jgi:hypothetical protein